MEERGLSRRASLTFVSSMLQQAARFIVGFVVTPIIIRGLGAELYGAWMMIQQTVGYLSLSDLRPMGTLKFTLAVRQHVEDVQEKRRQIGSAILIWACMLPVILTIGLIIVWATPFVIRTASEFTRVVQIAMALMVFSYALNRILSLPANVLRGMNMDYKAMGLNAGIVLFSGFLSALAIWLGWGLPGVAAASIAGVFIASAVRFLVAKRAIPWFGAARPARKELIGFTKLSGWLLLSSFGGLLLTSSDLLLIGIILGPSASAVYATTGVVLRLSMGPVGQLLSSGGPGIAELCGRGEWHRLGNVRTEMHVLAIGIMTVVGVCVIALNEAFLKLWVGDGFYGGNITNLFLVLIAFQMALFRVDGVIVDSMLEFRRKAFGMLISGGFILFAGGLMSYTWGLAGMAISVFVGRLGLLVYLPLLITRRTLRYMPAYIMAVFRPLVTACPLFLAAYGLSIILNLSTWLSFTATAALLASSTAVLMWCFGLRNNERERLLRRIINSASAMKLTVRV